MKMVINVIQKQFRFLKQNSYTKNSKALGSQYFGNLAKYKNFDQEKLGKYLLVYKECGNYKVVILLPLLFLS